MTMIELSVGLSAISGAIGGGIAGGRGGSLATAAGTAAGAVAGMMAAAATVGLTGLFAFGAGPDESPQSRQPGRLAEVALVVLVVISCFAPVWVPFLTYHLVALFVGHG